MSFNYIITIPIIFPILFGSILPLFNFKKNINRIYISAIVILNSLLLFYLLGYDNLIYCELLRMTDIFNIVFRLDGASKIFLFLLSTLWPLATIYSFSYMEHEENVISFFRYYVITYGVAVGVALSANLITLYLFYELLTFITLPLIMHKGDNESIGAGRFYLIVSVFGASLALIGIFIISNYTHNIDFVENGIMSNFSFLTNIKNNNTYNYLYIGYLFCFFGFGVKAALFPFTEWLPKCGVAPTPVSALLHAVAVVKAGVFAILRVTYFVFGTQILKGTYAQYIPMIFALFTILYGSTMAIREQNIKRRLAYSTASNLSYILFAITLMTKEGLLASYLHIVFHGIIKIVLFFMAGALIVNANVKSVKDVNGLGKSLSKTFAVWTLASLGAVGLPLTCGFISKYYICEAAIIEGTLPIIGIVVIGISAIFTVVYLFTVILPAYFPNNDLEINNVNDKKDLDLYMFIPSVILLVLIFYFGINSQIIVDFIKQIVKI